LHDNTTAHQAFVHQKIIGYLSFQCLDHAAYSPDLAPLDYHLFPEMEKRLKGRHFLSYTEVIAAAKT
jgi:histone-lysine N-methyltransferase SETMAR